MINNPSGTFEPPVSVSDSFVTAESKVVTYYIEAMYEEFHPSTYRGFKITYTNPNDNTEEVSYFRDGGLIDDWTDVLAFLHGINNARILRASSVDSLISDLRSWLS